jgi:hypothetical protein
MSHCVVEAKRGRPGAIALTATSDSLTAAKTTMGLN